MAFADTRPKTPFGRRIKLPEAASTGDGKAMPTVMIMAYDWGTGAHAVVSDRLSQALQRKGCKVVIFTDEQTNKRMNGFSDVGGKLTVVTHPDATIQQSSYFKPAFEKYHPNVIITEHYPMDGSWSIIDSKMINPCLKYAKAISAQEGRPLQVHALVRDIPDADILPAAHKIEHYDSFLVRGDEKIYSYASHFDGDKQWNQIKDKIHYMGYATDNPVPKNQRPTTDNSVLVSLGGGGDDK